jgi:hypothetical protein
MPRPIPAAATDPMPGPRRAGVRVRAAGRAVRRAGWRAGWRARFVAAPRFGAEALRRLAGVVRPAMMTP